jgi:mRNA interferase HigB
MRVVGTEKLHAFSFAHANSRAWLSNWLSDSRSSTWNNSHDIKLRYPSASFLSANQVIFNVKGNDYRLVTQIAYQKKIVVIKWIGTHAEYSKVNWEQALNEIRSS